MKAKRRGIGRWRRLAATPAGVGLAAIALLASALLGLRIPVLGFQEGLPSAAPLDYSGALPGELAPLQDGYVEGILGKPASETLRSGSLAGGASRGRSGLSKRLSVAHALTNDEFENAYAVSSVPFTAKTNTTRASREPSEPSSCGGGTTTTWYRYTPAANQSLAANTFGSDYTISLGVFVGSKIEGLRQIGCSSPGSPNAQVGFVAKRGDTYFFRITGEGGSMVFTLDPAGRTTRVSLGSEEEEGQVVGLYPSVSADGRFVAFQSNSPNLPGYESCSLHPPPTGDYCHHVYVRDRRLGVTEIVDVSLRGETGNDHAKYPFISANGRFVAFISWATNLVDGDTNEVADVFVRDLVEKRTTRVSVSSSGEQAQGTPLDRARYPVNRDRVEPSIAGYSSYGRPLHANVSMSADGRYVAFDSFAGNLVAGDTNACEHRAGFYVPATPYNCRDAFVHDRSTHRTTRVSVSSSGDQGNENSSAISLSPDGRLVIFNSRANNLVPGDPDACIDESNNQPTSCVDIFAHDRLTGATEVVSVSSTGQWGDRHSMGTLSARIRGLTVSADNRYVVFDSWSANFDTAGKSESEDVFVRDLVAKTTTMVSVSEEGAPGQCSVAGELCPVHDWSISADGRYVAFSSLADNLVLGDTNEKVDVFVKDLVTGALIRASVSSTGAEASGGSWGSWPSAISSDGRYVVFQSEASNLVTDDTNGLTDVFIYEQPIDR